jgi:UDPglucose--hexose-1-phosphate uridylyltransferase
LPELRIDPLTGLRVIVAAERADRPGGDLGAEPEPAIDPEADPFLEGHEDRTPPELWANRPNGGAENGPGWVARSVPNLYPALDASPEAAASPTGAGDGRPPARGAEADGPRDPLATERGEPDLFPSRPAAGSHEVIVNSPRAVSSLAALEPAQAVIAMEAWRERMRARAGAPYLHLIVNEGRRAGASLPHTHAQLYALPFVPAAVARERERFMAYANRTHGRDLLADVLQEEVRRRERVVAIDAEAVALCPFASRVPFQVQIVPRQPRRRFEDDGPLGTALLQDVMQRLREALGAAPPLNMWVRTAPSGAEHFCWRIELLPRLVNDAGLELGVGVHLNVLTPERAAELLRA